MNTGFFRRASTLVGAVVICIGFSNLSPGAVSARAEAAKMAAPQVVLAGTYNTVTRIYFTNIAVHRGSHKPGAVARRFQADVKYWLMYAKYYDQGELSIGNPPLVELVRELGSKSRPENAPTTLSAMAYEMARGDGPALSDNPKDRHSFGSLVQVQTQGEEEGNLKIATW